MDQPNNNPQPTETETRPEADGALFYSGFPISQQSRLENFMDYGSVLSNNLMEDAPIQMDSRLSYSYVNATTPLNEFVVQYDKAVAARRKSEEDEDFSTLNSQPALITEHGIEKDAGRYYTRSIFQLFQREWHASLSLEHTKRQISDMLVSYFVGSDREQQTVEYDSEQQIVRCSCAKFETDGILCKHALYILKKKKIKNLPKNYLLYRWTIDARYHMAHKLVESEDAKASDHVVSAEEKWVARTMFHQIIRDADYSPSIFKEFIQTSKIFMVRLRGEREVTENALIVESSIQSQSTCEVSHVELEPTQVTILDPACDKVNKGRPKSASRIPSAIEKIKNYKCSECKRNGHNKTTCPEKKVGHVHHDDQISQLDSVINL